MSFFEDYTVLPVGNYIIAKRKKNSDRTESGIYVPQTSVDKSNFADVISVGNGIVDNNGNLVEMQVKEGDMILVDKYSGVPLELDDEEYIVLRETEVIAVIRQK